MSASLIGHREAACSISLVSDEAHGAFSSLCVLLYIIKMHIAIENALKLNDAYFW
jgi:hypothetical protein